MPDIQQIYRDAASLEPGDRLRLIARLWVSMPADHWAAPTAREREEIERRLDQRDFDALADASWRIADRLVDHRQTPPGPKVYSAPRRFDLATIFVVTSAYGLLFGALNALGAWPIVSAVIAGFITIVGIGQALLFGGKKPRAASVLVGVVLHVVIWTSIMAVSPRFYPPEAWLAMVAAVVVSGVMLGYCAGGLVGGVFLLADVLRGRFGQKSPPAPPLPSNAADAG